VQGCEEETVEICYRLSQDRDSLLQLGANLYREFLQFPLTDEPSFIRGIKELLLRAWTERCPVI
jgi:hypothetical protein